MNFDWNDLAFGSKKPIRELKATFIAAPREISAARFTQLVREYLPQGNIVLGLAKENCVLGFEDQPQFCMLKAETVQGIIDKVNQASAKNKIYTLNYFQRELSYTLEKLNFKRVIFVNGSWKYSFHTLAQYFTLAKQGIPYQLVTPFANEAEAKNFLMQTKLSKVPSKGNFTEPQMQELADQIAKHSYDYSFQTGVALGRQKNGTYELLGLAFNKVVPYQTYAMHHGASRETNFSPTNDLNHYDATHAEVELIIKAQKQKINLSGTTLFINLLPCPSCARMLSQTDIAEFVYCEDHSDGYAVKLLELADKKVRRVIP